MLSKKLLNQFKGLQYRLNRINRLCKIPFKKWNKNKIKK